MKKIIYDFFSDLFNSHVHLRPHYMREDGHVIPEVLPPELRHTIMSVRNRTAPYPDRIRFEHPKNLPSVLINTLARLFTRYLSKCKVPKQWKTGKTVLLYKKGDPHDIGNYRPICLLFYKLFTRLILNRIEKVLDEGQPCKQAEFRREFSKIDQIHTVFKLIEISREYKMPPLHQPSGTNTDRVRRKYGCIGLQLNLEKTMFLRKGWVSDASFTLYGTNISECTSYVYLGRELNMMNDLASEQGRRKLAAKRAYKSIVDVV
ncbi:hypothetical protein RB195_026330 [Necator americanus]